ncbi:hypothetical protein K6966_17100 [Enterobacter cloacae complex sp.]|nr:hypothetical protein K6966_17100 [Enterobacter cloacae complex sp.]
MAELTKQWLQQKIADMEATRDDIPFGLGEDGTNTLAALRIALASLEAEPAIHRWRRVTSEPYGPYPWHYGDFIGFSNPVDGIEDEYFYSAQPAPVVPDEIQKLKDGRGFKYVKDGVHYSVNYANGWNQCRAAMLQGAGRPQNEPQNIPENIPATQFKPVADLYGLTSPTGGETSFTFDAVEARDFIDVGWSCQDYVELERFQEAVSGNSPVIPDGWVLVPEEPTHEMLEAGDEQFGTYDVYRRMIAASPQQEVK